ncbi:MAG: diacylglycerol kinase family protein [Actinomycetaceae bacterium]|nr:diacylglycerol kinase family protein [Actinomycetaceae bacterium]
MSDKQRVPYVIYNPAKITKIHQLRKLVTLTAAQAGFANPVWVETTPDEPGTTQAIDAVANGADLVLAAGGDGTVRAIGAGLAGTGVPMGIIPLGTGNLLGRNLNVPPDSIQEAIDIAFFGFDKAIDVAWMKVDGVEGKLELTPEGRFFTDEHREMLENRGFKGPEADEFVFVVIAGQGWDARMMSSTNSDLKDKVGWGAYVVAGAKALRAPKMRSRLELDDTRKYVINGRSLLFANCSSLMIGVVLAPDAKLDDGLLDIASLETSHGLVGWADLFTKISAQGLGIKNEALPGTSGKIDFIQAKKVHSTVKKAHPIQVDGDALGKAREMRVRVDKQALIVRHG